MLVTNPNTVPAPAPLQPVRNSTLNFLELGYTLPSIKNLVHVNSDAEYTLNRGVRAAIQLTLLNNMRISECLNIKSNDEIKPSIFLVRAKKKGINYSIYIPISGSNRVLLDEQTTPFKLFPFTYHFIWYSMVKSGLSLRVSSRVNRVVTHRGRFDLAAKLEELNQRANITPLLHHKSKSSKKYYLPGGSK